jgi:hypothetical protein
VYQANHIGRFYDCCAAEREQAPSPQKRLTPVELCRWNQVIQHPVHRQFTQHDGLLNAQHGVAMRAFQHGVHLAAHIRGSQLKLIPGLAHRFQEAFKAPLLAAVLPYLQEHREDTSHWAQIDPVPSPNLL